MKATFSLHTYRFGGKLYQQLTGGPIGLHLTACVAKIRVAMWLKEVREKLHTVGVRIFMGCFYVMTYGC